MESSVQALSVLAALTDVLLVVYPTALMRFLCKHRDNRLLYLMAVAVRLVAGVVLITQADASRFPQTLSVLGWLEASACVKRRASTAFASGRY